MSWTCTTCLLGHALVSTEAQIACLVDIPNSCRSCRAKAAKDEERKLENIEHRTSNTERILIEPPKGGTPSHHWSAWQGLHLHFRSSELRASALGYTRAEFSFVDDFAAKEHKERKGNLCVPCVLLRLLVPELALPAGFSPATATFEASHSDILSYGSKSKFPLLFWAIKVQQVVKGARIYFARASHHALQKSALQPVTFKVR